MIMREEVIMILFQTFDKYSGCSINRDVVQPNKEEDKDFNNISSHREKLDEESQYEGKNNPNGTKDRCNNKIEVNYCFTEGTKRNPNIHEY